MEKMADKLKSQKIAAARKKLKEFQSKHKSETDYVSEESITLNNSSVNDVQSENATTLKNVETSVPVSIQELQSDTSHQYNSTEQDVRSVAQNNLDSGPNVITNSYVSYTATAENVSSSIQTVDSAVETPTLTSTVAPESTELSQELYRVTERNQELCSQLWMQHAALGQMKHEIERLKAEQVTKFNEELEIKDKQLQSQLHSIEILINEKTELSNELSVQQNLAKTKSGEVEELQARLFASRYRGQVLEKELDNVKNSQEKFDHSQQNLCTELENARDQIKQLKKSVDDSIDEIAELKQKLALKTSEIGSLSNDLANVRQELNLSQLRVEQFSAGNEIESSTKIETILTERNQYERQVLELQQAIQQINLEREQADQQYQNYVQHLNKESTNLVGQIQTLAADNERLAKRETELTKHVSDLERQIQQQMAKRKSMSEVQKSDDNRNTGEEVSNLIKRCEEIKKEKEALEQNLENHTQQIRSLSLQLQEKIEIIAELEAIVEQIRSEQPNSKSLLEAIESDKVAASRAMAQNQELKNQLDEIQKAYIQLSNDKLELTDRLQSELHFGSEIKNKFGDIENELTSVREKLHYKDEEMIRLSHENEKLNKQILQQTQELDRLRHYEAKSQSGDMLHRELLNAHDTVLKLRAKIKEMERQDANGDAKPLTEVSNEPMPIENGTNANGAESENGCYDTMSNPPADSSETMSISSTLNIATDQAMDRLQQRFTRTMAEVADLTEEKHRLEHLVMQLQGETETIGEYIALYQNQRRLLKQREIEKDIQLQHIANERESMRQSLARLNNLVVQLLMQNGVENAKELVQSVQNNVNNEKSNDDIDNNDSNSNEIKESKETTDLLKDINKHTTSETAETATEILRILSEIKEKNLSENFGNYVPDIHHCHCCSGKLETV